MSAGPRTALVLAGGGARGAYEAGVLRYLFTELAPRLDRPVNLEIVCGTSAGALNGCWVAGYGPAEGAARELSRLWTDMHMEQIFRFTALDLLRSPRQLWGQPGEGGLQSSLLDASPLHALVRERMPWRGIQDRIASGMLHAVVVASTEVATGRLTLFVQRAQAQAPLHSFDDQVRVRDTVLTAEHCLASAAIPFLFPPIRVDGRYYLDGALRQNTPLNPALRLGADRVLVVGVKRPFALENLAATEVEDRPPSLTFLIGKALNAVMLEPVERDLKDLQRWNAVLRWGRDTYGPDFLERLNAAVGPPGGGAPYRPVETLTLRPHEDLGALAAAAWRKAPLRANRATRMLIRLIAEGENPHEADTLSYLLFDRAYTAPLEELGYQDASHQAERLARFLS